MSRIRFTHVYNNIISFENLLGAWKEFICGKRSRKDVQEFELNLMSNILSLQHDLTARSYSHDGYEAFNISDPKPRHIHKASVRDRLLHHAIYRILYPFFDRTFIADSYSCRINKAGLKAINRFRSFVYKESESGKKTVWILKCDIRKFFDNIDHDILLEVLNKYIEDKDITWLLERVLFSFSKNRRKGLPLGNLTSQLFVNIYMNEFDQFVKHKLKVRYYIRYADDFVIFSQDKSWLQEILPKIGDFLSEELKLNLHTNKIFIKTIYSGLDFLGWVHFPNHRVLRTTTKRRMIKKIKLNSKPETVASYLGLLKHGNIYKIKSKLGL